MFAKNIIVRQLSPFDWEIYKETRLAALKTDPDAFGSTYAKESARSNALWQELLVDTNAAVFVLFDNDSPFGMAGLTMSEEQERAAILWGLWIAPPYRKQGLSSCLYEAAFTWSQGRSNLERILISHYAGNVASKSSIRKQGFLPIHDRLNCHSKAAPIREFFYQKKL